ncbi:MAG: hypothetical protein LQ347_001549, partial [Umbilicaria vellea]
FAAGPEEDVFGEVVLQREQSEVAVRVGAVQDGREREVEQGGEAEGFVVAFAGAAPADGFAEDGEAAGAVEVGEVGGEGGELVAAVEEGGEGVEG